MQDAMNQGLRIGYFPIEKYVSHLSGASWCIPKTVWKHDYGVKLRPLVTFVTQNILPQTDNDYQIIHEGNVDPDTVIIHDGEPARKTGALYHLRFNVFGDYVVMDPTGINSNFVHDLRKEATINDDNIISVQGNEVYKRSFWQYKKVFST